MFKNTPNRHIQIIGLLFFAFYAFLSLYFFKERMLSFDSAAYALEIIQTKTFHTPLGRWSSVLSQALPLLFLKLGCSLSTFLKVYSLSFILIVYLGFLFLSLILKDNKSSIIYLLTFCLVTRHTFYFSIAELPLGVLWSVVLYSMVNYSLNKESKKSLLLFGCSFIMIFILYYFHQLMFIGILFILFTIYFSRREFKSVKIFSLILFTLLWFGANILLISGDSYEGKKIPGAETFIKEIPHFFELPSYRYFIHYLKSELLIPVVLVVSCIMFLIYKKKLLLSVLFILFPIGYLILITITYYKGESPNMYELYFVLFGLFFAITISSTLLVKINNRVIFYMITPLLFYCSVKIYNAHFLPSMRIHYLQLLTKEGKKLENRKYVIHPDDFPWGYGWVTWAIPSETLLLSSLNNKSDGVVCYVPNFDEVVDTKPNDGQLLGASWQKHMLHTDVLDTQYFQIPMNTTYLLTNRVERSETYFRSKIRFDIDWREDQKKKAKERGISLEEMITIDAQYVVEHSEVELLSPVKIKK